MNSPESCSARPAPACPLCASLFVEPSTDPAGGGVLRAKGQGLFVCKVCKLVFAGPVKKPPPLPSDTSPETSGSVIERDYACPHCEYNLRTLRFGGQCPECGNVILPPRPRTVVDVKNDLWTWWDVSAVLAIVAGPIVITAFRPSRWHSLECGICALGVGFAIGGLQGVIKRRVLLVTRYSRVVVRGGWAIVLGVFSLTVSASCFVAAVGLILGWFK